MTVRKILLYPRNKNELRKKSEEVERINSHVKQVIIDLKETLMAHGDGIGLAAPQINEHDRVIIVCLGAEVDGEWQAGDARVMLNPRILEEQEMHKDFDGCLSFPGLYGETERPHTIRVAGENENGESFDEIIQGFNAVVVHHEVDHLEGVLFIDRVTGEDDLYTIEKNDRGELVRIPFRHSL